MNILFTPHYLLQFPQAIQDGSLLRARIPVLRITWVAQSIVQSNPCFDLAHFLLMLCIHIGHLHLPRVLSVALLLIPIKVKACFLELMLGPEEGVLWRSDGTLGRAVAEAGGLFRGVRSA